MRSLGPGAGERISAAICRLLQAIEVEHAAGPIGAVYQEALARHGRNLFKAGGAAAMRPTLEQVCAARPERAAERRAVIAAAWDGLGGWGAQ